MTKTMGPDFFFALKLTLLICLVFWGSALSFNVRLKLNAETKFHLPPFYWDEGRYIKGQKNKTKSFCMAQPGLTKCITRQCLKSFCVLKKTHFLLFACHLTLSPLSFPRGILSTNAREEKKKSGDKV